MDATLTPPPQPDAPLLPASFERPARRLRGYVRIDVDAAGIARTDSSGQRRLRWSDVRLLTRSRGSVLTLADASRRRAIAIPRTIEHADELLTLIEEQLLNAYTTRVRPGSRRPSQDAVFHQQHAVVISVLTGSVVATMVCAHLFLVYYVEALLSVLSALAYLAVLPNTIIAGPDRIETMTPVASTSIPTHAVRDVRLHLLSDRGPIIVITVWGGAMVELRGFGDQAIFLHDALRQVMQPGPELEPVEVRKRFHARRALPSIALSTVLFMALIGLPVWNGRLIAAGVWDSPQVIDLLLSAGAPLEGEDKEGRTLTYNAAKYERTRTLKVLLERGSNPHRRASNEAGHTPLHVAAERNQRESVRMLLAAGVDPNIRNNWKQTPLMQLATLGRGTPRERSVIDSLLAAGADVNAQDKDGYTAVHFATIKAGRESVIRTLMEHGGDFGLRTASGNTAFDLAVGKRNWSAANVLAEFGDVNLTAPGYDTHLRIAVSDRDHESIRHLLELGVRTDIVGNDGFLPIQVAADVGDVETIGLLAAAGAQLDARTEKVSPALLIAYERGQVAAMQALLDRGAWADVPVSGWTTLQRAAFQGRSDFARILLAAGANANVSSPEAPAPLLLASERGHVDVVKVLLESGADVHVRRGIWTAGGLAQSRGRGDVRALLAEYGVR